MIKLSKRLLKRLYYTKKKTKNQIAIILGYSLSTIKRNCKRYDIKKISQQPICIDCGIKIGYYRMRCRKCNSKYIVKIELFKGKNHPKWKGGNERFKCIDCGCQITSNGVLYGTSRCKKCAGKKRQIHTFCMDCGKETSRKTHKRCRKCSHKFMKGINHPNYGKPPTHGKHIKYKEIWMRSYFEVAYAKYLDKNNIKWLYESKTFDLKNGRTYTPDFYLSETDEHIEVKGWWRDDAKKKFNKCKQLYNKIKISVMDEKKLIKLGINTRQENMSKGDRK